MCSSSSPNLIVSDLPSFISESKGTSVSSSFTGNQCSASSSSSTVYSIQSLSVLEQDSRNDGNMQPSAACVQTSASPCFETSDLPSFMVDASENPAQLNFSKPAVKISCGAEDSGTLVLFMEAITETYFLYMTCLTIITK